MKETYLRPKIYFETFAFSQTIARNCGDTHNSTLGESTHYNEETCAWDAGGILIFLEGNTACEDDQLESIEDFTAECYNNPDGGQEVFSSL